MEQIPSLEEIRRHAREAWTSQVENETSYQDHYADKFTKIGEFTTSRPTSTSRRNKPHPKPVFLTNRLHYVPGYHNPDTTLGKEPYKIDASVPPHVQTHRSLLKSKYIGRPSSNALRQYRADEENLEFMENPLDKEVHAALIGNRNDTNVLGPMHAISYRNGATLNRSYRPKTVASLHRHLRPAGVEETLKFNNIHSRYFGHDYGAVLEDLETRKQTDMRRVLSANGKHDPQYHVTRRGDFCIHPEWPPKFVAHRLNGLSSVDIPYSYSNR